MNYQAIRAAVEGPLLTAFNNLSPAVPVYFDNITATPPNTTTEYVRVNVTFGITNEPRLVAALITPVVQSLSAFLRKRDVGLPATRRC